MYDPNLHAERALQVITEEKLRQHAIRNDSQIEELIELVKKYSDLVIAVSVGNENTPTRGAHRVSED